MEKQTKVYVVEDDEGVIEALSLMLGYSGYQPIMYKKSSLFKHIQSTNPDIVLLDLGLDGIDGKEVAMKLKSNAKTKNIPIILLSGNAQIKEAAEEVKADSYLAKPFEIDELVSKITSFIK